MLQVGVDVVDVVYCVYCVQIGVVGVFVCLVELLGDFGQCGYFGGVWVVFEFVGKDVVVVVYVCVLGEWI